MLRILKLKLITHLIASQSDKLLYVLVSGTLTLPDFCFSLFYKVKRDSNAVRFIIYPYC